MLAGVETFNEYFDWHYGTDRVFQLKPSPVPKKTFYVGVISFAIALIFSIYLTIEVGWGILIFSLIGFIAAAGYLGPPLRLTYRGLGEIVIALSYGPFMVTGSYYLQSGKVATMPVIIALIPGLLLFQIAILNEVPDFIQDRLVGKRNLCVRMGSERVVSLHGWLTISFFLLCISELIAMRFPWAVWAVLLLLPLAYYNYKVAHKHYNEPPKFLPAIRGAIILYVITLTIFMLGLLGY